MPDEQNPVMRHDDPSASPVPWAEMHSGGGRVLFTRLIARRNFAGFPFWISCTPEVCAPLSARAESLARTRGLGEGTLLASLSPTQIGVLRERMILPEHPVSTPATRNFKQVFLGKNPGAPEGDFALLGESEQWTQVRYAYDSSSMGRAIDLPFESLRIHAEDFDRDAQEIEFDQALFARSPSWGFLTSNPAYAGTGLQCESGLHLPALAATRSIPQVRQGLAAMGLELLPLTLRDPGVGEAGFFRVVARGGPEHDGASLCQRFADKVGHVLATERTAWETWMTREGSTLEERMVRSLSRLQEANSLECSEALSLVSLARAGVYADLLPNAGLARLETLRVRGAPFHIRSLGLQGESNAETTPDKTQNEGGRRATLARQLLTQLP